MPPHLITKVLEVFLSLKFFLCIFKKEVTLIQYIQLLFHFLKLHCVSIFHMFANYDL